MPTDFKGAWLSAGNVWNKVIYTFYKWFRIRVCWVDDTIRNNTQFEITPDILEERCGRTYLWSYSRAWTSRGWITHSVGVCLWRCKGWQSFEYSNAIWRLDVRWNKHMTFTQSLGVVILAYNKPPPQHYWWIKTFNDLAANICVLIKSDRNTHVECGGV